MEAREPSMGGQHNQRTHPWHAPASEWDTLKDSARTEWDGWWAVAAAALLIFAGFQLWHALDAGAADWIGLIYGLGILAGAAYCGWRSYWQTRAGR